MKSGEQTKVEDIMTRNPHTLQVDDVLDLADDLMSMARIRHIPILERGKLIGIVSQRDLFFSALVQTLGLRQREQKDLMKTIRAREVMTRPVITISPGTSVKEAARLMAENKIGCLPVVKDKEFVGIVTETDILDYVATH
ncbi:MAG TPA: CBS domain-containing protein [Candidatus Binatia bacterium]